MNDYRDLMSLVDEALPDDLLGDEEMHLGRIVIYALLGILFLVSAWRTGEFLTRTLSGSSFEFLTWLGVAAVDGAFLAWEIARLKSSNGAQVGISTTMWVTSLVAMLATNLGDLLMDTNKALLNPQMQAARVTIGNVLILAIPILTVAHVAAASLWLWYEPAIALQIARRRAKGEVKRQGLKHAQYRANLTLKAQSARALAAAEQEAVALLEETAKARASIASRAHSVRQTLARTSWDGNGAAMGLDLKAAEAAARIPVGVPTPPDDNHHGVGDVGGDEPPFDEDISPFAND